MFRTTAAALLLAAAFGAKALAADWQVDKSPSAIDFAGTHAGQDFTGTFARWDAEIVFDPAALEEAKVTVTIETGSATTGDGLRDGTLPESDWFDVAAHPTATYAVERFVDEGGGRYEAEGSLTIRGKSVPVALTVAIQDGVARIDETLVLNRMDFDIGAESDASGAWVSLEIPLSVSLRAVRQ